MKKELKAHRLSGLDTPISSVDAVTKGYADASVASLGNGAGVWYQYSYSFADLAAASLTNDIELFSLPGGGVIHDLIMTHTVPFSGGGISAYSVSVGIASDLKKYALPYDVFQAAGSGIGDSSNALGFEDKTNPTSIRLAATSVGANLNAATAGQLTIFVRWSNIGNARLQPYQLQIGSSVAGSTSSNPSGTILAYGGAAVPNGYLRCDGTAYSRTAYAGLFAAISTNYGVGDGSTTFNVPNLQGVFLRGAGSQTIGAVTYTGTLGASENDQFQGHEHFSLAWANSDNSYGGAGPQYAGGTNSTGKPTINMLNDGTNGTPRFGTETQPANVSVTYIIKI